MIDEIRDMEIRCPMIPRPEMTVQQLQFAAFFIHEDGRFEHVNSYGDPDLVYTENHGLLSEAEMVVLDNNDNTVLAYHPEHGIAWFRQIWMGPPCPHGPETDCECLFHVDGLDD